MTEPIVFKLGMHLSYTIRWSLKMAMCGCHLSSAFQQLAFLDHIPAAWAVIYRFRCTVSRPALSVCPSVRLPVCPSVQRRVSVDK